MRPARSLIGSLVGAVAVSTLVVGGGGTAGAAGAAHDPGATASGVSLPGTMTEVRVGTPLSVPSVVPAEARRADRPATATFTVTYTGFTPAAKTAFQRAVDIWAGQLNSGVPVTVAASFEPLGPGVLGSAGPSSVWRDFAGAPQAGTWYVDAVANKRRGSQLDPSPDIVARFSSNFSNWHYGTGPAPTGKYDFTSVVLHELGHGVGFIGAANVSSNRGTVRLSGYPLAYSRYTETNTGTKLLSLPDSSTQLAGVLRGNNVYFDSPKVRNANGGATARLYAPSTWQPGSSYSHLDEATYRAGDVNSLMTPQIGSGETIRNPGPITKAVLLTTGW